MNKNAMAFILLIVVGCRQVDKTPVHYENDERDTSNLFFPVEALADTIELDSIESDSATIASFPSGTKGYVSHDLNFRYSRHLSAMKAEILKESKSNAIRLTWLRTFGNPVSVTLIRRDNTVRVRTVTLSGAGGYEPGEIRDTSSTTISASQWDSLSEMVSKIDFRKIPEKSGTIRVDGTTWILEVSESGTYKFIDWWGGGGPQFVKVSQKVLDIGKVKPNLVNLK